MNELREYRRLIAASVAAYEAGDEVAGLEFENAAVDLAAKASWHLTYGVYED